MLSVGRFNLLFTVGPSVAKTLLSITALGAFTPGIVFCAPSEGKDAGNGDEGDIFLMMARKARAAMDSFSADSEALKVDPKVLFEAATKKAHTLIAEVAYTGLDMKFTIQEHHVSVSGRHGPNWLRLYDGLFFRVLFKKSRFNR